MLNQRARLGSRGLCIPTSSAVPCPVRSQAPGQGNTAVVCSPAPVLLPGEGNWKDLKLNLKCIFLRAGNSMVCPFPSQNKLAP